MFSERFIRVSGVFWHYDGDEGTTVITSDKNAKPGKIESSDELFNRRKLIHILHMAYSGELAAGLAYSAHWRSLRDASQRVNLQKIEQEEWVHRKQVGKMLATLDEGPQKWREVMMWTIGRTVGLACFVIGWFMPMYFAGRLENDNVQEYDHAAFYADKLGLAQFKADLLEMSLVEHQHETFFKEAVAQHPYLPFFKKFFGWGPGA